MTESVAKIKERSRGDNNDEQIELRDWKSRWALLSRATKLEAVIIVLAALVSVGILTQFYLQITPIRQLDSVFLIEAVGGIAETGQPVSEAVSSWPKALTSFTMTPDAVCKSPLKWSTPPKYNVLDNHAYYALYPITALSVFTGPERTFALLNALAHLALLFLPYLFLRREGIGVLPSAAFSVMVASYPGWYFSASGDYYLDRLFMPWALLLLYLIHSRWRSKLPSTGRRWLILLAVVAVTAAIHTERGAIMIIGALLFAWMAFPQLRRDKEARWGLPVIAAGLIVYVVLYLAFIYKGVDGGGSILSIFSMTWETLVARLQNPGMVPFFLTNLLFLGWLSFFSGLRYMGLLVGAMLPNILITVGGAELNEWHTHYHAEYIPFLIFSASLGYLAVMRRLEQVDSRRVAAISVAMVLAVGAVILSANYDPYKGAITKGYSQAMRAMSGNAQGAVRFLLRPEEAPEKQNLEDVAMINASMPRNVKISTHPHLLASLYRNRQVSWYPIGLADADYLIFGESSARSYLGPAVATELNRCLVKRAEDEGFVKVNAFPQVNLSVYRRAAK